ncbi:MAG: hypothetical protein U1E87_07875 [Alphaproteobacteria bacterium]
MPAAAPEAPPEPSGISAATAPGANAADAPPHAYTIAQQTEDLARLLESAPAIRRGSKGPALFIVAFHGCPACIVVHEREAPVLEAAGIDVRWILYARRDKNGEVRSTGDERSAVAELVSRRDFAAFDHWMSDSAASLPTAKGAPGKGPDEAAVLEAGRALVDRLNDIVTANALPFAVPALFWKDGEMWRSYIGYDENTFAEVRASLGIVPSPPSGARQP